MENIKKSERFSIPSPLLYFRYERIRVLFFPPYGYEEKIRLECVSFSCRSSATLFFSSSVEGGQGQGGRH